MASLRPPSAKIVFTMILLLCFAGPGSGQGTYVIVSRQVEVRDFASFRVRPTSLLHAGDTVVLKYLADDWVVVVEKNGRRGFANKRNLSANLLTSSQPYFPPGSETGSPRNIDLAGWSFGFLFSATLKYFLILTACIFGVVLIVYYLK